jgi:hypothetical protein
MKITLVAARPIGTQRQGCDTCPNKVENTQTDTQREKLVGIVSKQLGFVPVSSLGLPSLSKHPSK